MSTHPFTGEFSQPEQEAAFRAHALPESRARLGILLVFHALFQIMLGAAEMTDGGPHCPTFWFARLAVIAAAAGAAWQAGWRRRSAYGTQAILLALHGVVFACIPIVATARPRDLHWHALALAVTIVVTQACTPLRFRHALLLAAGATALFLGVAMPPDRLASANDIRIVALPLLATAFGTLAARHRNRAARIDFEERTRLQHAAARDHLTGCFNRRYLHDDLMRRLSPAVPGRDSMMTVVLCDIDHFKQINDRYGHACGDVVLRSFATLLETTTRGGIDSVVRYGGEEFVAILPDTDLDGGIQLAERLRQRFAQAGVRAPDGTGTVSTTASFGVASIQPGDVGYRDTLRGLIAAADQKMYDAKRSGRNCVRAVQLSAAAGTAALPSRH